MLPIALAATLLLHLFGISVDVPRLGKIARKMLFSRSRAVCEGDVVTIICLVGAGHCGTDVSSRVTKLGNALTSV